MAKRTNYNVTPRTGILGKDADGCPIFIGTWDTKPGNPVLLVEKTSKTYGKFHKRVTLDTELVNALGTEILGKALSFMASWSQRLEAPAPPVAAVALAPPPVKTVAQQALPPEPFSPFVPGDRVRTTTPLHGKCRTGTVTEIKGNRAYFTDILPRLSSDPSGVATRSKNISELEDGPSRQKETPAAVTPNPTLWEAPKAWDASMESRMDRLEKLILGLVK